MKQEDLTELLAIAAREPARLPSCPDEHQVAGYVDGGLDADAHAEVEAHLADCSHCVALVALLIQERGVGTDANLAQRLPARTPVKPRQWFAPQWAAAATVVLAVPLLFAVLNRPGSEPPADTTVVTGVTGATRSIAQPDIGLQVVGPVKGTADSRLAFQWTAVNGTPFYDLRIVNDEGDVVLRERVNGTTWTAPAELHLQPGAEYYVHVDAYPSGDKVVSSDHVRFQVVR